MNIYCRQALINADTISSTTKTVLLTLLSYCHGQKDTCFPSLGDMSQICGLAKRTIRKHLRILEQKEIIETTKGTVYKSNHYKILALNSVQMNGGTVDRQLSNNPEGLKESYVAKSCQDKKAKSLMDKKSVVDDRILKNGRSNSEAPAPSAPAGPLSGLQKPSEAPAPSAPAGPLSGLQKPSEAPAPSAPAGPLSGLQKPSEAPAATGKKKFVPFSGVLTNNKLVEIYNYYCKMRFINDSTASLLEFVSVCAAISRLEKKGRIKRSLYALLTYLYKNKKTSQVIITRDEEVAARKIHELRELGLIN